MDDPIAGADFRCMHPIFMDDVGSFRAFRTYTVRRVGDAAAACGWTFPRCDHYEDG
jgi:hypothetical protein